MRRHLLLAGLAIGLFLALYGCQEPPSAAEPPVETPGEIAPPQIIKPATVSGLQAFFESNDYDLNSLEAGVPQFILKHFPHDLDGSIKVQDKKMIFFLGLAPMVLLANDEIAAEREELQTILANHRRNNRLSRRELEQLEQISTRYGLRGDPLTDHRVRTRLLKRVDTLPPALVLAQAANESAWGTSRFARMGNNLFGQWTFTPGTGIVPEDRPEGETYEIRQFKSLYESIRSYMLNLNTHWAYLEMREIRHRLRSQQQPVTGLALADGLNRYSIRGEDYVAEIQAMIRHNRLSRFNLASLRNHRPPPVEQAPIGAGLLASRDRMQH